MKTLRRWLGVSKRQLIRLGELKTGILLYQPGGGEAAKSSGGDGLIPEITKTARYREDLPWSESEFTARIRNGNVLYELFVGDQSVCYGWVAEAGTRVGVLHDLRLVVPAGGYYIWDCATAPAVRGKGYFRTLLHELVHGIYPAATLALVAVDSGNGPSRKALANAGFQPMFTYLSARFMRRALFSVAIRDGKIVAAQSEFDRLGDVAARA